jgi:hypothetical protein
MREQPGSEMWLPCSGSVRNVMSANSQNMDYALLVEDIKSAIAPYCRQYCLLLFSLTAQCLVPDASGGAQTHFGGAQYTFWASSIPCFFFFFK